ncbi:MAG: DUF4440 domain-containing protein [Rhodoglobus sp.]
MMDAVEAAILAERALLDPVIRSNRTVVERLLAADFTEIGRSGRLWTRAEIIEMLERDPGQVVEVTDFDGRHMNDGVVLVTYVANSVRRSTLWRVSEAAECEALFHQGTPIT